MTEHCGASPINRFASEYTSAGSESGGAVRYRLEAAEIEWEMAPGRKVRGYGFNGQVPGPVLEAKQGIPLEIEFTNRLPEPTVIHWHGLQIPAAMDGTRSCSGPSSRERRSRIASRRLTPAPSGITHISTRPSSWRRDFTVRSSFVPQTN